MPHSCCGHYTVDTCSVKFIWFGLFFWYGHISQCAANFISPHSIVTMPFRFPDLLQSSLGTETNERHVLHIDSQPRSPAVGAWEEPGRSLGGAWASIWLWVTYIWACSWAKKPRRERHFEFPSIQQSQSRGSTLVLVLHINGKRHQYVSSLRGGFESNHASVPEVDFETWQHGTCYYSVDCRISRSSASYLVE